MQKKIEYLKTLPKKRIAVGVLLFNDSNQLLVLKPSYKDHWTIPGGVVNEYESPIDTAIREAKEEIGIDIKLSKCLLIDFTKNQLDGFLSESLQLIFLGEKISDDDIKNIIIGNDEIIESKFVHFEEALKILSANISKRLNRLNGNFEKFVFMENGIPII